MEAAAAALPRMRAFAGRLWVAARMRDAGGRTRQNVHQGYVDAYTTNIISSRDFHLHQQYQHCHHQTHRHQEQTLCLFHHHFRRLV